MGNKLRDMFDKNSEYNKNLKELIEQWIQESKENHCCEFCIYSEQHVHIEHGKVGGYDNWCSIHNKYMLKPNSTCLLFEEK